MRNNINIFFPFYISRKGVKTNTPKAHRGLISYKDGKFYNAGKEIELTKEELEYLKRVVDFRVKLEDYVIGKLEKHPDINIEEFKSDSFNKWAISLFKILDKEYIKAKKANPKGTKQEWATSWLIELGFTQNEANTLISEIGPTPNLFNTTEIAFLNSYRLDSNNLLDKSELGKANAKAPFEAVDQILESISTTQPTAEVTPTAEVKKVWDKILKNIKDNIESPRPSQTFKTWFEPIKPIKLKENVLTIEVPSGFFKEWLEEHYIKLLEKVGKEQNVTIKINDGFTEPAAEETSTPEVKEEGGFNLDALKAMTSESSEVASSPYSLPYTTKTKSGKTIADAGISLEAWIQMSVEEQNKHIECN